MYRKMFLGDFFEDVLNPPLAEGEKIPLDPEREPMDKYTRGTWTGLPRRSPEEPSEILKVVTLAKTTDTGRRWEVDFADPVRARVHLHPRFERPQLVHDQGPQERRGAQRHGGGRQLPRHVIHIDDHFYKMKTGQSFSDAMDAPPMTKYTPRRLESPAAGQGRGEEGQGGEDGGQGEVIGFQRASRVCPASLPRKRGECRASSPRLRGRLAGRGA